ncbi:MAG: PD40 domain-containing protein [Clostridia bacterium]|nr:PD40 domain-containing protein [Clostridia bacterium]
MRLKKILLSLLLAALAVLLPLVSGCAAEDPTGPRTEPLLVYVGEEGLYACSGDGENRVLLVEGEYIHSPRISPDGRYVYFNNSSDIFVVPTSGGTPTLAAAAAKNSGFLGPRLLSYSSKNDSVSLDGIYAFDPENGVSEALYVASGANYVSSAALSYDCRKLAVSVSFVDVGVERSEGLYIRYMDMPELDRFTAKSICGHADWQVIPLCWLSDGGALVLSCGSSNSERAQLYVLPIIDGAAAPLGSSSMQFLANSRISLSADGKTAALLTYRSSEDLYETICIADLTRAKCSYIPSGSSGVTGTALSPDGDLVAYTSGGTASGLFVYANDTTLCVEGGDGKSEYSAPFFSEKGTNILFVGWGERLLAELDSDGNPVGTYTETIASVYSSVPNSAGSRRIADGLKFPDGVYTDSWYDMYDYYEYIPPETGIEN